MDSTVEIRTMLRRHLWAGAALLLGMAVAVALAVANAPVGTGTASAILLIATAEAAVIATVLMHLDRERSILVGLVVFTAMHLLALLVLPALGHFDRARF